MLTLQNSNLDWPQRGLIFADFFSQIFHSSLEDYLPKITRLIHSLSWDFQDI